MKKPFAGLLCIVALLHPTHVDSDANIVGSINKRLADGDNLLAAQPSDGTHTLSRVFA